MHKLYTLGYTGLKPAQILAKAIELGAIVLDIRYAPRSRVPQWNGMELQRLLEKRYAHLPALGNVNYKGDGPIEINLPNVGTQQVVAYLDNQPVILLCACPEYETCHRKIVAEMIQAACNCEVINLSKDDLSAPASRDDKPQQHSLF